MNELIQAVEAVSSTIRSLFADKGELKGYGDWDAIVGCVITLNQVANALREMQDTPQEEIPEESTIEG